MNLLLDDMLTDRDWDLLLSLGAVLEVSLHPDPYHMSLPQLAFQVPHRIQQAMSSESMPVLSSAVALYELFMSAWEDLREEKPELAPWINVGLYWAKKYYRLMDDTDAYIVTMGKFKFFIVSQCELTVDHHSRVTLVLNPCIRFRWITDQWGRDYIKRARTTMLDLVSTSW
jgi:hypothetical protein